MNGYDPKIFHEYRLFSGKDQVSSADGSHISITGKGNISLVDKYHIRNVLNVSDLPLNLLFVSKFTKELVS